MRNKAISNINELNIEIYNKLRLLGFKSCNKSTKILARTILYIKQNNIDFFEVKANEIYTSVSQLYPNMTQKKIKDNIDYALSHRNISKTKANFQTVFKFDYAKEIFTNKNFIEEFLNIFI